MKTDTIEIEVRNTFISLVDERLTLKLRRSRSCSNLPKMGKPNRKRYSVKIEDFSTLRETDAGSSGEIILATKSSLRKISRTCSRSVFRTRKKRRKLRMTQDHWRGTLEVERIPDQKSGLNHEIAQKRKSSCEHKDHWPGTLEVERVPCSTTRPSYSHKRERT